MPAGAQAEFAALSNTSAQVQRAGPVQDRPVWVLSRAVAANASARDSFWASAQDDLAARYPGARHLVARSGHYIHADQQDWFCASVKEFLAREVSGRRAASTGQSMLRDG
jgi:hypothetical protein